MNSTNKIVIIIIILLLSGIVIVDIMNQPFKGPDVIPDPIQGEITAETIEFVDKNGELLELTLLATYQGDFGVKHVKSYTSDGAHTVSPKDVVLAWGELNQAAINEEIDYRQSNRWYYYSYSGDSVVNVDYIAKHSANTHLIPMNESILQKIKKINKNDYVHLEGYLVAVHFEHGDWKSSTTREDTGNGACEIFYVTEIIIY